MGTVHLNPEELQKFRSKTLSAKQFGVASRHLQECDACARRLREGWAAPAAPRLASDVQHLTYEDMSSVLDRSATTSKQEWVEEHSRVCAPCSRQLRDLRNLDALLAQPAHDAVRQPAEQPHRAHEASPSATMWGFWAWVNGSLAAALAVALVMWVTVSRVRDDASAAASANPGSSLPIDKSLVGVAVAIGVGIVFLLLVAMSRRRRSSGKKRSRP